MDNPSLYTMTLPGDFTGLTPVVKAAPTNGSYGGYSGGAAYVDAFNKARAPSPMDLVRECLNTAYACATLNSDLVAKCRLKLYVKSTRRRKSKLIERGDTRPLTKAARRKLDNSTVGATIGDATDLQEVVAHPVLDLLRRPNANLRDEDGAGIDGYTLVETTQRYLETVGRAYWYVERDGLGNTPSTLWILPAHLVREVPDVTGQRVIDYYEYSGGVTKTRYEIDEIIPFRFADLNTAGYIGGFSPLRACFEQVKIFRMYAALTLAQLSNGGKPSAVWSPTTGTDGDSLGDVEMKRARDAFRTTLAGAGAGGVVVLPMGGKLDMLSWPANEIVTPDQYGIYKRSVANCFGVPTSKLDRDTSTLASAKTGDYAHAVDAGLPRLRRIEATLNCFLVPMYPEADGVLFFAYDDPESMRDEAAEFEKSKAAASSGALLRNEVRSEMGFEAVPWGDQPLIGKDQIPVDLVTGIPQPPTPPPALVPNNGPPNADDPRLEKALNLLAAMLDNKKEADIVRDEQFKTLVKFAVRLAEQRKTDANEQAKQAGVVDASNSKGPLAVGARSDVVRVGDESAVKASGDDRQPPADLPADSGQPATGDVHTRATAKVKTIPPRPEAMPQGDDLAAAMRSTFAAQRKAVLSQVETKALGDAATKDEKPERVGFGGGLPDRFIPLSEWDSTLSHEVMPLVELIVADGGKSLLTRIGASPDVFHVVNRNVPEAARKLTLKFCTETNATTSSQLNEALDKLRDEIATGLDVGDTRVELTKRVNAVFDLAETSRADCIAKTEASRAIHAGEIVGAKASGVVKKKKWLRSSDACPVCDEIADAYPDGIDLDGHFGKDGYGLIESPPGHPNCQCSLTYELNDLSDVEATRPGVE